MPGIVEAFTRLLQRGGPGRIQGEVDGQQVTFIHNGGGDLHDKLSVEQLWATEPHLRTVVDFVARSVAQLNLHVFRRKSDENERVFGGLVNDLIHRPNPYMTRYELFYALVMDLMLYDAAYLATLETADGWELHVLPSSWVTPVYGSIFEKPRYEAAQPGGGLKHTFSDDEILAWRGWTPGFPEHDTSPVESLKQILAEQRASRTFRAQNWKNGGRFGTFFTRPKDAPQWTDADRKRFMEMLAAFAGNRGPRAGMNPVLEDGISPVQVGFKSADEEWSQSVRLSLETVAQVYHINPTMVGVLENANYSNVREFRRSLYGDSLGPVIVQLQERLNTFLLPRVGAPRAHFVEFNVEQMLRGSFEEQATVLQASVGGPWMTVNEARRLQNLPPVDGGDDLIRPLSVSTAGGDAEATEESAPEAEAEAVSADDEAPKVVSSFRVKVGAVERHRPGYEALLSKYFERQHAAVVAKAGAKADGVPSFWDAERWDRELAVDLEGVGRLVSAEAAREALESAGFDPGLFDEAVTEGFLKATSRSRAEAINGATLAAILDEVDGGVSPADAVNSVFERAKSQRVGAIAGALAAAMAGWGTLEAGQQSGARTKTWITGANPRKSHAALNGQTVPLSEKFSNGLMWPGDSQGVVDELAGCNCELQINYGDE